jgi:hypothetical protein
MADPERVAIIGPRDVSDPGRARALVFEIVSELPDGVIVVSGGAKGIDTLAREIALAAGHDVIEYVPIYGKGEVVARWHSPERPTKTRVVARARATDAELPKVRNTFVAIGSDRAFAFTHGSRGGTLDCVAQLKRFKKPVVEVSDG